jgi:predicted small lipoprotein YifL
MKTLTILRHTLFSTSAILLLGACGQKGPLYLPGNPSEIKTEVPAQNSPADDQDKPDDDDSQSDDPMN